eukprot:gene906-792_t
MTEENGAKVVVVKDPKPERPLEVAEAEAEDLKATGGQAYKCGDFLEAIKFYEDALDALPDTKEGEEVHRLEPILNSNLSAKVLEQVLRNPDVSFNSSGPRGQKIGRSAEFCYAKEKEWEACIAASTNAINGNPKLVKPHYHLINSKLKQGRSTEAKEHFEAALEHCPDAPELADLKKVLYAPPPNYPRRDSNASSSSSDAGSDYMANLRKLEIEKKKIANKVTSPGNLVNKLAEEGEFTRLFGIVKSAYMQGNLEQVIVNGTVCLEQITPSTNGERVKEVVNYLARGYMRKKQMDKAAGCFEKLFAFQKSQNVGPKELSTTLNNMGMCYKNCGKYSDSEKNFKLAIEEANRGHGEGSVFVATMWNNLGQVYRAQKKHAESVMCYRKAQNIREQALGRDHASLTIDYIGLARATRDSGKLHEALLLFDRVLNMWRGRPDEDIVAEMPEMPDATTFGRFKNEIATEYAILLKATKDRVHGVTAQLSWIMDDDLAKVWDPRNHFYINDGQPMIQTFGSRCKEHRISTTAKFQFLFLKKKVISARPFEILLRKQVGLACVPESWIWALSKSVVQASKEQQEKSADDKVQEVTDEPEAQDKTGD